MYDATPRESFLLFAALDPAPVRGEQVSLDLTSAFRRTYEEVWNKAQFIMAFSNPSTDVDFATDSFHLGNSSNPDVVNYNRVVLQWLCADDCWL